MLNLDMQSINKMDVARSFISHTFRPVGPPEPGKKARGLTCSPLSDHDVKAALAPVVAEEHLDFRHLPVERGTRLLPREKLLFEGEFAVNLWYRRDEIEFCLVEPFQCLGHCMLTFGGM